MPNNPTYIGSVASIAGSGTTLTASHTLPSGQNRIVIASIGWEDSSTPLVNSVYYDIDGVNVPFTYLNRKNAVSGDENGLEFWVLYEEDLPATGGPYNVKVTFNIGCDISKMLVFAIKDANQSGYLDYTSQSNGSAGSLSGTLTPCEADALSISCCIWDGNGVIDADSGQTEIHNASGAGGKMGVSWEVCSGDNESQGWDSTISDRCCHIAAAWAFEKPTPTGWISWFS